MAVAFHRFSVSRLASTAALDMPLDEFVRAGRSIAPPGFLHTPATSLRPLIAHRFLHPSRRLAPAGGLTPSAPYCRFRSSIPSPHIPLSNASSAASRPPSHDSGTGWFAIPFLNDSHIHYSTPVYPDAIQARRPTLPETTGSCPLPGSCRARASPFPGALPRYPRCRLQAFARAPGRQRCAP